MNGYCVRQIFRPKFGSSAFKLKIIIIAFTLVFIPGFRIKSYMTASISFWLVRGNLWNIKALSRFIPLWLVLWGVFWTEGDFGCSLSLRMNGCR